VLVRGLGLGIPIVSLVTLVNAYSTLRHDGVASWDQDLGCTVTHRSFTFVRIFMLTVMWLALILILGALRFIA
jgi:hypothetical protein